MNKQLRHTLIFVVSLSLVGLFGCQQNDTIKMSPATNSETSQENDRETTPGDSQSTDDSKGPEETSEEMTTKAPVPDAGTQVEAPTKQPEVSGTPNEPKASVTSDEPAVSITESVAQVSQGTKMNWDQVTMEELALPENLSHLSLKDVEGEAFLDPFSFDGTDYKLTLSAIPMAMGSVYGQTQGVYTFTPGTGELKEEVNLLDRNTRVLTSLKFEDKVYLLCITGDQAQVLSYGEDHVLKELIQVPVLDNPYQLPVLTRLDDDILFVAPSVEADHSTLRIYSLKGANTNLLYEGDYSFSLDPGVAGEKIKRLGEGYGNQVYAFFSSNEGEKQEHLNILEKGSIKTVALDQAYTSLFTSGNKVLLTRDGESQPTGERPAFAKIYDVSQGDFGEEVKLDQELQRCIGLGDGAFLLSFVDVNTMAEAKVAVVENNELQVVKDLGPAGGPGFIVRTSTETACIYCQDRSGAPPLQRMFLVHLSK